MIYSTPVVESENSTHSKNDNFFILMCKTRIRIRTFLGSRTFIIEFGKMQYLQEPIPLLEPLKPII